MTQAWAASNRRERLPADWKTRRATVLRRDSRVCYVCRMDGADEVDHVVRGDDHSLDNLAAIHHEPCHREKTAREAAEAIDRMWAKTRRPVAVHPGLSHI